MGESRIHVDEDDWLIYVDGEVWGRVDFDHPFWKAYQGDTLMAAQATSLRGLRRRLVEVIVL